MRTLLLLLTLLSTSCIDDNQNRPPLPPPPTLEFPAIWRGTATDGQYIVIMTPQTYWKLHDDIATSRNWMRQAGIVLAEDGLSASCPSP